MARFPFLVLSAVAIAAGCASGNHLIGTWVDPNVKNYSETINADQTYSEDYGDGIHTVHIAGTWTYEGQKLHYKPTDVKITGGTDDANKKLVEKKSREPIDRTLDWQDDDHFTARTSDGAELLQRKK